MGGKGSFRGQVVFLAVGLHDFQQIAGDAQVACARAKSDAGLDVTVEVRATGDQQAELRGQSQKGRGLPGGVLGVVSLQPVQSPGDEGPQLGLEFQWREVQGVRVGQDDRGAFVQQDLDPLLRGELFLGT